MYNVKIITADTFRIEDANVAMYLLTGSDRALLIDTGYGSGDLAKTVRELYGGEIVVAHTHGHGDHIGADAQFDLICGSKKDSDLLLADGTITEGWAPLKEGDVIDLGDRTVRVLETPGHTPGSLSFADEKNNFLFTGDQVSDVTVYLCVMQANVEDYIQSLKRVIALGDHYTKYFGHHGEAEQTKENAQKLLACAESIADRSGTTERENAYGDVWFNKYSYAGASVYLPMEEE